MRNALVTGGAGFIGSHLVRRLTGDGYNVTVLDDLSSGRVENIADLLDGADNHVRLVRGSVTEPAVVDATMQDIDFVFHLAAIASVPRSVQDPVASHEVNLTGTLNVLRAAAQNGAKKVVFISSSAVYGDTPVLPQVEDMLPAPQSPYAVTKLAGEYYCRAFREVYGLETVCLRYFNVFGPRQDPASDYAAVIPKFISMALEGRAPVIFGTGEQTRDFVYVKDAVGAAVLAAGNDMTGVFNIGSGKPISVEVLARRIIEGAGRDMAPLYREARTGDILHSLSDISRAKSFGYIPKYSLEEGLAETIAFFRRELAGVKS